MSGAKAFGVDLLAADVTVKIQEEHIGIHVTGRRNDALGVMVGKKIKTVFKQLRLFEIQIIRGLFHTGIVFADQRGCVAAEDTDDFSDIRAVLFLRIGSNARALALSEVEIQARTEFMVQYSLRINLVFARAQRVDRLEELDQCVSMPSGTVGPEISGALSNPAGNEHSRKRFLRDAYPRIGLGVLQQYIILGLVLLDEIVLQKQRVCLRVHHRVLRVGDFAHEHARLRVQPLGRHEILRHPLVQVLRLAHIDNRSLGVVVSVDSGGMWKQRYFIPNVQGLP